MQVSQCLGREVCTEGAGHSVPGEEAEGAGQSVPGEGG